LIATIRARVGVSPGVLRGIGDDAAELELPAGHRLLTSTDLLLEGVHFDFAWISPFDLGAKAVAVNLSDIAAMGGTARFLYIGLACPAATEVTALRRRGDERMTSFSASTTRKNTSPPAKSQGHTCKGTAWLPKRACSGGA